MTLESPADWVADGLPPKIPEWEEIGNTARAFGQRVVLAKIALVKTRVRKWDTPEDQPQLGQVTSQ